MVDTAILPNTDQRVYLVCIPIQLIFPCTRWFIDLGAAYGTDWGWWNWHDQSNLGRRYEFAPCWTADSQLALMAALRWC